MNKTVKNILKWGGALILGSALYSSCYTIHQTEQAVITRLGKPVRVILNPIENKDSEEITNKIKDKYTNEGVSYSQGAGLHFKIPFFDKVNKFDRRIDRWNGYPSEIPTGDKVYIWVNSGARFSIADPLKFYRAVKTRESMFGRLDETLDSNVRNSITKRNLIEIVKTTNREMKLEDEELRESSETGKVIEGRQKIIDEIVEKSKPICLEEYGINLLNNGILIKGLIYNEDVKASIEKKMIEERKRIATKYRSEGEASFREIVGKKEKDEKVILSEAYKEAQKIRGEADAKVLYLFKEGPGKAPEFYTFITTLDIYKEIKNGNLILGTDSKLLKMISGEAGLEKKAKSE